VNELAGSNAALGTGRILGLLLVAVTLGGGQLLFKLAAGRLVLGHGAGALAASFASLPMIAALGVYAVATILWVYLLHGLPLSRAYPFVALAFALVPLLSWLLFDDTIGLRYGLGLALMLAGLYLVASGR
jgi:multidrug transporter EmrE-like cation transporter